MFHCEEVRAEGLVKVFNCFKSTEVDRQIGDRRGANSLESRLVGPSRELPCSSDLFDVAVDPRLEKLVISITDRRDFYHQILATKRKAISNTVGPAIPMHLVEDDPAFSVFLLEQSRKRYNRTKQGDHFLHGHKVSGDMVRPNPDEVWLSFCSILQGDHAGVELATEAHTQLLQDHGLLDSRCRLTASSPLRNPCLAQGLSLMITLQ